MFSIGDEGHEDGSYNRARNAIERARTTEGATEAGLWRTAIVESAAAITEALFALPGESIEIYSDGLQELAYKLGDVAEALEKIAGSLPDPGSR